MIDQNAAKTAAQCRHYAMCKIDYLGTGLCPSGPLKHFVSYYPQGRMDIYRALAEGFIPVTDALVDVADSCTLCGICDRQCHFITGMKPGRVMAALKDHVGEHITKGRPVLHPAADSMFNDLQAITGPQWVSNDTAILVTYADDPFPLAGRLMPRYVVLPGSTEEVVAIVKLASRSNVPFAVRGNGGSVFGFVFSSGIVLDMNRMRKIEIDRDNWCASVGPGVTSFELQKAAAAHSCRINAAEPAATVCGNIVCTGTFSTWTNVYGTAADNFIDMEFVDRTGKVFHLDDKQAPNVFAFEHAVISSPGICTEARVKLHPVTDDEEGVLVPFADFDPAVKFARELSQRRIGLAVGVLGRHYISSFLSPDEYLAERLKTFLPESLGIRYVVFAVADAYGREAIRRMAGVVIDQSLLKTLMLGLPRLLDREFAGLLALDQGDAPPFEMLCDPQMRPLIESALKPTPQTLAQPVDNNLRGFYRELYARPEMTDMVWLNEFRILSARMSRHKHMFAFLVYVPLDKPEVTNHIIAEFGQIADRHLLEHDYGFLTPLDFGKRAILEYDYYIDHTDPAERRKIAEAMPEIEPWLDSLAARIPGVTFLKYVFSQGCSRKENFLYRRAGPDQTQATATAKIVD